MPPIKLRPKFEKLANLMDEAEHDALAYMSFPARHRTKLPPIVRDPRQRLRRLPDSAIH